MGKQMRKHSNEFKARVALEALRGLKTVSAIAAEYQVHPTQVANWKKQGLESIRAGFRGQATEGRESENPKQMDSLYKQIGKLQVECDFLRGAVYPRTA